MIQVQQKLTGENGVLFDQFKTKEAAVLVGHSAQLRLLSLFMLRKLVFFINSQSNILLTAALKTWAVGAVG